MTATSPPQMNDWGLHDKPVSGAMLVGDKGNLFADYDQHRLLPEKDFAGFTPPPKTIPGSIGHHKEWVTACLKNDPAATTCRFDYSGALTEAVLLGNVAFRTGKRWNGTPRTSKRPTPPKPTDTFTTSIARDGSCSDFRPSGSDRGRHARRRLNPPTAISRNTSFRRDTSPTA